MFTPKSSPWGAIQHLERISPEIVAVQTAGHGGLCLSVSAWLLFPGRRYQAKDPDRISARNTLNMLQTGAMVSRLKIA